MTEWPQPISPQVLRTRLAAFKDELCDANFRLQPCASCAREKRQCKLSRVSFPPAGAECAPEWLSLTAEQWRLHSESWFNQVHELLAVDSYLRRFFLADEQIEYARREVNAFGNATSVKPSFATKEAAESWVRRVECWRENLRRDLVADSIPAPGSKGEHWLFSVPRVRA